MASRSTAFRAEGCKVRSTAFRVAPLSDPPTNYTVVFAPDGSYVQVVIAADFTQVDVASAEYVFGLNGQMYPLTVIAVTEDALTLRFWAPKDGVYWVVVPGSDESPGYQAPVLAYYNALACQRDLNPPATTGGKGGQATVPHEKWQNVYGRTRLAIAAFTTRDYARAQQQLDFLTSYCTSCGCQC